MIWVIVPLQIIGIVIAVPTLIEMFRGNRERAIAYSEVATGVWLLVAVLGFLVGWNLVSILAVGAALGWVLLAVINAKTLDIKRRA